jgi:anti-sigma B factor antagonist
MASRQTEVTHGSERMAAVEIDAEHAAGLRVVTVRGELDLSTAPKLDTALEAALAEPLDLMIDLRGTDFVDCAGIHSLAAAARTQARAGRSFAIACAPRSQPARLFQALVRSGFELPVHHSRGDALLAAVTSTPVETAAGASRQPLRPSP